MTKTEHRASLSLACLFALRMLGLFMILPTFALYAHDLQGATPTLIGLALGVYGLTQALLQIPLGMLSDRLGRHPTILLGLLLFIAGSLMAALSHTLQGIIIGRALQGAGAVGSTMLALLADLTTPQNRTKAMAFVGMAIGLSVMIALAIGPVLTAWIGIQGIFWVTALMGLLGIALLALFVPTPPKSSPQRDPRPTGALFFSTLTHRALRPLNMGIGILHMIFTASFIAIPFALRDDAKVPTHHQWLFYLPTLILAFVIMLPVMLMGEKRGKTRLIFLCAIGLMGMAQLVFLLSPHTSIGIATGLLLFFVSFTLLESTLPSLVSKAAPTSHKGTAMGIYSTAQFLGIFLGGTLGGWLYGRYNNPGIFLFCTTVAILWLVISAWGRWQVSIDSAYPAPE